MDSATFGSTISFLRSVAVQLRLRFFRWYVRVHAIISGFEPGNNVWVLIRHVCLLARVILKIEELQGSSSCDDPPPKRFRLDGQPGRDSPPREDGSAPSSDSSPVSPEESVLVSRWERSVLLTKLQNVEFN